MSSKTIKFYFNNDKIKALKTKKICKTDLFVLLHSLTIIST